MQVVNYPPLLSIIIVNYNVKYFLEQCLYSVQRAITGTGLAAEVIVVDNNSSDESVAFLQPKFPAITFIVNKDNVGYARANNQGWQQASGNYILFLNPDTIISEDSLHQSLALLDGDTTIGATGIRMIDGSGRFLPESRRGFPTPLVSFYKLSGLTALFPRSKTFARYYMGHLPENKNHETDVLAGAFMLVRKKLLQQLGGFDEQFFMYGEDVDLSYRLQKAGYKNMYLASSSIIHFKGESTQKDFKYVQLFYTAMSLFVKKHYRRQSWWMALLLQLAIWCRAGLSFFKKLFGSSNSSAASYETLVVGGTAEIAAAVDILSRANDARRNIQTRAFGEDIETTDKKAVTTEIVFCAGYASYKDIITQLQQLPHGIVARFHTSGSSSIVSSISKNTGGEVLIA